MLFRLVEDTSSSACFPISLNLYSFCLLGEFFGLFLWEPLSLLCFLCSLDAWSLLSLWVRPFRLPLLLNSKSEHKFLSSVPTDGSSKLPDFISLVLCDFSFCFSCFVSMLSTEYFRLSSFCWADETSSFFFFLRDNCRPKGVSP